jgi:hypothetical protein
MYYAVDKTMKNQKITSAEFACRPRDRYLLKNGEKYADLM